MAWPRGLREAGLALLVAVGVQLGLTASNSAVLRKLETAALDLRFRLRGVEAPGPEIAVVLVDERSLAALGRWPLSRRVFAKAVEVLDRADARLIVFDLLFSEPEEPVPSDLRDEARLAASALPEGQNPKLRAALGRLAAADPDADFAAAIRASGRVLLPVAFAFQGEAQDGPSWLSDHAYQRLDNSPIEPRFPLQPRAALLPLAGLAEAAAGLGHVNIAYDQDGAPRYDYLAVPFAGDFLPSLAVRAAAAYRGVAWPEVGLALGEGVRFADTAIPTDPAMRLVVNYRGPRGTIPTLSFADLVEGRIPADRLKGRIVLIGASFIGIADANPAPFDNTQIPGTERLATLIDSILAQDSIRENPPPWPLVVLLLVAGLALLTGVASALLPTRIAACAGVVPVAGWCLGVQAAFLDGLWLPVINPVLALVATVLSVLLFRYGVADKERRGIQSAFRHYLAPELVNTLASHPERLQLGGETRNLTVMFSDIRGFTSISEAFKTNPQGLSRLINRGFLTPMTRLIMERRGTIDKYMGDCVMAFWNAPLDDPLHADHACASALAMIAALDRINAELQQEATAEGRVVPPIHIGVGLNTGEVVVGNMGSNERFAYTAMGDAVNLASRLEGQSKTYHVAIVIGEDTRAAAPTWAALELDLIAVKGKREPVRIYTLLGDAEVAHSPEFVAHAERHDCMLAAYRARDWETALALLRQCRGYDAQLCGFYALYEERIAEFTANPPPAEWAGVYYAETK